MIIPGESAPPRPGAITDTTASPLPYPEVYLPPATTVWLNGTLGWGPANEGYYYLGYYDPLAIEPSHVHYTVTVAIQFRLLDILSMSSTVGQASTITTFHVNTSNISFEEYRAMYGSNDRDDYEAGIVQRTDGGLMIGVALHALTSETDLVAGEVSAGFDARFQDFEDGFDWTLMLAARYQPTSALRIRLGGMLLHDRLTALLSIGVAP